MSPKLAAQVRNVKRDVHDDLEEELRACVSTDCVYQWMYGLRQLSLEGLDENHVWYFLSEVETVYVYRLRMLSVANWGELTTEDSMRIARGIVVAIGDIVPESERASFPATAPALLEP